MVRLLICVLIALSLTSCSLFSIQKQDIEQGNIITPEKVSQLHRGMSMAEVREIMGTPLLTNLFTPNRIQYVYTMQKRNNSRIEKRVTCVFQNGRLVEIT